MTRESLLTQDWESLVARLGGAAGLKRSARVMKGFLRSRAVASAVDLLRLILAYCLGEQGLRSTAAAPQASRGRLIQIIDATTVPQPGVAAKRGNRVWRIHSAFDLPRERFGHFELIDQKEGETLDRIPVVKGEIRIGDRAISPDRIAGVLEAGADIVVRAGWKNARWLCPLSARLRQFVDFQVGRISGSS